MTFNVRTFFTRATTALVFAAVLLGCVYYSYWSFLFFFTVVGFIGLYEFYKLSEKMGAKPIKIIGYFILLLTSIIFLLLSESFISIPWDRNYLNFFLLTITIIFPILFIVELFRKEGVFLNIGYVIISLIYVVLPIILLLLIAGKNNKAYQTVLGMIFFIWINDTGAYLVGSFLGKHKLYEKISPGKTWEGTIGGVILCIALAYVVYLIFPQLAYMHWLVISIIVAVFGTLGDLVESMLKRMAGVKDSGNLMPGHGGILDRFDSLFFATPFVFCYLTLMGLL